MKTTLKPGLKHRFAYKVPENKTVPYTYPEAPEIASMPKVFATGNMIVLMEWTCTQLLAPHLDPGEGSLGVHVDVSHLAATVPGQTVTVDAEVDKIVGNRVGFKVKAHDGIDLIGEGSHERFVVVWDKFNARLAVKAKTVAQAQMANSEWRIGMNGRRAGDQVLSGPACLAGRDGVGGTLLLTRAFPREETFGLSAQIRRSATSIPANIAEGHGRENTQSFIQYLRIAQGSLKELETHLLLAQRVGLVANAKIEGCLARCEALGKMVRALIRALQAKVRKG